MRNIDACFIVKLPEFLNEKVMKRAMAEFANFLYELNNRFVHNAHLLRLSRECYRVFFILLRCSPFP
jgi:hypothetical protein